MPELYEVVDDVRVEPECRQVDDCVTVIVTPRDERAEAHQDLEGG